MKIGFVVNPTVLTVNGERMPLERPPEGSMSVVIEEDIRLPTRTAVFGRDRLVTGKKIRKEVLQEEESPEESEIVLCETVVEAAEIMPIQLVNQSSKTVKVKREEEARRALPLRTLQWVKLNKKKRCMKQVKETENEEIVALDRFKAILKDLLRDNQNVVAKSDKELGQTSTVMMRIDMGDHRTHT